MTTRAFKLVKGLLPPIAVGVAASVAILPHTYWVDQAKAVVHSYKHGMPVPVSPSIHELFVKVKSDLVNADNLDTYGITTEKLNNIKLFSVFGFDVYRLGWLEYNFVGHVGVPEHFTHDKKDKIRTADIRVGNESIDWNSEAAKLLEESFHNSTEAKKFAIAKEVLHLCKDDVTLNTYNNVWNTFLVTALGIGSYERLRNKPKPLLFIVWTMIAISGVGFYTFFKDASTNMREKEVDEKLCSLGLDYCMGGTEYYYNIIRRNMALRQLLGSRGEKTYTALGNEKSLIRLPHMPVTDSAELCRNKLQEHSGSKEIKTEENSQ